MFDDCSKLKSFPNMIKPKISDINEMIRIYRIYLSLSSLFLLQKLKKNIKINIVNIMLFYIKNQNEHLFIKYIIYYLI